MRFNSRHSQPGAWQCCLWTCAQQQECWSALRSRKEHTVEALHTSMSWSNARARTAQGCKRLVAICIPALRSHSLIVLSIEPASSHVPPEEPSRHTYWWICASQQRLL